jgi:hypothetical protein
MSVVNFWAVLVILGFLSGGCGGGGGAGSSVSVTALNAPEDQGTIAIAITDAEGDYDSYTVDVTSVVLQRSDGSVVETLPLSTRIDFSELTEVTEFLTIATVPAGRYHSAVIGLDYTDAEIIVQDDSGALLEATPVDEAGARLEELSVRLQLTEADSIVIRPGIPAAFSLDFDLDASNTINLTVAPPTVTVLPFLLASAELEADRAHRVRGLLDSVDQAENSVTLNVRPFRHRQGNFGQFSFLTDEATAYEINGEGFIGEAGLAELATLDFRVPVIAGGPVEAGHLVAHTVLVGTSVPWTDRDVVQGVVVARADDALTLSSGLIEFRDGVVDHRGRLTVLVGENTRVSALGLPNDTLTRDSISVGQRIVAFGELADDRTLDATESHVRMQLSDLTADVVVSNPLALDLYFQNGRRPVVYDYSGTGVDPAHDADPEFYEVDTSTLPLSSVTEGDLVRVRGHVSGWMSAPADFLARTLIDVSLDMRSASFVAHWPEATGEPLLAIGPGSIELDLVAARSILKLRGVPHDELNPLRSLLLTAPPTGQGVYAVRVRGSEIHLYRNFSDLVDEVINRLESGRLLKNVGAHGRYNEDSESLTTGRAGFDFLEPGM